MLTCILLFTLSTLSLVAARYEPTWESLDARPLPPWYDEAKVGIFIHWGVFSVPSFGSEWFWWSWKGSKPEKPTVEFMKKNYRPGFTYPDFGPMFTAEFFNPDEWADVFNASGARYVVLVSKHHEGFTNWPSKVSWNWNSMDVGPKRDLVGDLANSIRNKTSIRFGLYHSLFEWFNQLYLQDKANNFTTQDFVNMKTMPELYDLVNTYKPEVVWSDGEWEASNVYWKSKEFLAWLYNDSPVKDTVVTNDRWGKATLCKHGGYYTCHDRYDPGVLQKHKFENAMTLDHSSWGYVRNSNLEDYLTMDELLSQLASTISCGGNILINVGPTHDGRILPVFEERLRQLGQWLKVNGEGVYATRPWAYQNDTVTHNVWYTMKNATSPLSVFAIVLDWPEVNNLDLGVVDPAPGTVVSLLGYPGTFEWAKRPEGGISIYLPPIPFNKMPCDWAWVFKFVGLDEIPIAHNYRTVHRDNAVIDMTMKYYHGMDNDV